MNSKYQERKFSDSSRNRNVLVPDSCCRLLHTQWRIQYSIDNSINILYMWYCGFHSYICISGTTFFLKHMVRTLSLKLQDMLFVGFLSHFSVLAFVFIFWQFFCKPKGPRSFHCRPSSLAGNIRVLCIIKKRDVFTTIWYRYRWWLLQLSKWYEVLNERCWSWLWIRKYRKLCSNVPRSLVV